jgi:hypothetical protein
MNIAFLVAAALLLGSVGGEVRAGTPIERTIVDDANPLQVLSDWSSKKKEKQASRSRSGKAHHAHKRHAHKHDSRKHYGRTHHRHHGRMHHRRHIIYVRGHAKRCWVYHPLVGTFNRCTPRGRILWWRLRHGLY